MLVYHGIALGFIAMSLRVPVREAAGGDLTGLKSGAVIVSTYNTELRDALTQAIAELPQIEAEIIRERFYHGQTLKATGEHLGRSAEVVRSHEQKALRSLRKQTHLKKFVNRENVYIRTNFGFWKNTGMSAEEWIIIHNEERRQRPQKGKR